VPDENLVLIEGVVTGNPSKSETLDGRVAGNFDIESKRINSEGVEKFYKHTIVVWDKTMNRVWEHIKNGTYCKIRGHLQSSRLSYLEDGVQKSIAYDKVCADYIEYEE
jgi:single-stranded DNA-binding protein